MKIPFEQFKNLKGYKIESCFGNKGCPNSISNTDELILKIEEVCIKEKLDDFIKQKCGKNFKPHNTFKIGIANCPNACSQVQIKDFAIIVRAQIKYLKENCNFCNQCIENCEESAISNNNDEQIIINENNCIGCADCVKVCSNKALSIEKPLYEIQAGGKLGRHPQLAMHILITNNIEDVINIFKNTIKFYKQNSSKGERLGFFLKNKEDILAPA